MFLLERTLEALEATALGFFDYYLEFLPKFEVRVEMNKLKGKSCWERHTMIPELQERFQKIKGIFTDPECRCRTKPMALGEPGAGQYVLITDYSKDAIGTILHHVKHGVTQFIGAKGRKCRA